VVTRPRREKSSPQRSAERAPFTDPTAFFSPRPYRTGRLLLPSIVRSDYAKRRARLALTLGVPADQLDALRRTAIEAQAYHRGHGTAATVRAFAKIYEQGRKGAGLVSVVPGSDRKNAPNAYEVPTTSPLPMLLHEIAALYGLTPRICLVCEHPFDPTAEDRLSLVTTRCPGCRRQRGRAVDMTLRRKGIGVLLRGARRHEGWVR